MQSLCFTSLFCLETTALAFVLVPSLSAPQPFVSSGRHRWRCCARAVLERTVGSICLIYMYVGNPVLLLASVPVSCLPLHPEGWCRGGCHDGLPVGYVLPFDTQNTPPPPPAVVITFLPRPLTHHFSINHRHLVHRHWNAILLLILKKRSYHTIRRTCTVTYAMTHICNVKMRRKTFTKNYKHEIWFRHKRVGSIYISCACANACLPLFAEKSRRCNMLEIRQHQKVCRARGSADKNNHFTISKWTLHCTSLPRYEQRLCYIRSDVSVGAEKLLLYKRR